MQRGIFIWVPFLFYSLPEMGKLGKLQKSRKNKKLKNVDAEYSNEPRGSKKWVKILLIRRHPFIDTIQDVNKMRIFSTCSYLHVLYNFILGKDLPTWHRKMMSRICLRKYRILWNIRRKRQNNFRTSIQEKKVCVILHVDMSNYKHGWSLN